MFKLIPLALSLILAGSGAAVMSVPKHVDNPPSAMIQAEAGQYSQDSSGLFLKADANTDMDSQATVDLSI